MLTPNQVRVRLSWRTSVDVQPKLDLVIDFVVLLHLLQRITHTYASPILGYPEIVVQQVRYQVAITTDSIQVNP